MTLLAEFKKLRKRRHVSQDEAGAEIDRSQFWVSLVERGVTQVDDETLRRMIAATDLIVERRAAIAAAKTRVIREFENRKISLDGAR
jgi:transcriptional regulator with XRE-family HTH domain